MPPYRRTAAAIRNTEYELTNQRMENEQTLETLAEDGLLVLADEEEEHPLTSSDHGTTTTEANKTLRNFIGMSILFSANHGTIVACLSLATARLGAVGAWQSGMLYLCYTLSGILGSTYVVKRCGAKHGIILGMSLYCIYVGCFLVATSFPGIQTEAALVGAVFGGIGAGFLWTAQGAYFTESAQRHAAALAQSVSESTSYFAGIFAFLYLSLEVVLRLLSSALAVVLHWRAIFGVYTVIAILTTLGMTLVINYPAQAESAATSVFEKATVALRLLWTNSKLQYLIGLNASFGFAGAFLNSYVNGQVVVAALDDDDSRYVGALTAWMATSAAIMSIVTAQIPRKGPVLIAGSVCFFFVAFPFILQPDSSQWTLTSLVVIYTLQGIGRATFEATLKATFADYFPNETAGAFSNIILQNGLAGAIGYILSFRLLCDESSRYCIKYSDGTLHDVLSFELLVCITSVLAILGYLRASVLFQKEQQENRPELVLQNEEAESA